MDNAKIRRKRYPNHFFSHLIFTLESVFLCFDEIFFPGNPHSTPTDFFDESKLQQLIGMGFDQDMALQALSQTVILTLNTSFWGQKFEKKNQKNERVEMSNKPQIGYLIEFSVNMCEIKKNLI